MLRNSTIIRRHDQPVVIVNYLPYQVSTQDMVALAHEQGWRLLGLNLTEGVIPRNTPVIGAVILGFPSDPLAAQVKGMGCPSVFINPTTFAKDIAVAHIQSNLIVAGQLAAEHFATKGFRQLGYVGQSPWSNRRQLYGGFLERGTQLGCNTHLLRVESPNTMDKAERLEMRSQEIANWLMVLPKPVGILGYNDHIATKICMLCQDMNLNVPEDVSILGTNNDVHICELAPVPISSIDMNVSSQFREALLLLKQLRNGAPVPDETIMINPQGVVERQSTDGLAIADSRVATAIRYIWDHLDLPITDEDIARDIKVPLGTLKRLFQDHLGRSMNAELRRKRLEYCRKLLLTTSLSVTEICSNIGFSSKAYLYKIFKEEVGTSPKKYRAENSAANFS